MPPQQVIPPGVRAVFLDAVGTLLHPDPPPGLVYAAVGQRCGSRRNPATIPARFAGAFAHQERLDHATGLRTDEARELARWRAIVAEVLDDVTDAEACFRDLYAHFARPEAWRVDPEAGPTLKALAAHGYRLGLASNFDSRLRGIADALPELEPIRHLVISSEVGWRKPAPAFFRALCHQVELKPEEVLFVGDDMVNDYQGAMAEKLVPVLFDPRRREPTPIRRISRLSDLPGLLPGSE